MNKNCKGCKGLIKLEKKYVEMSKIQAGILKVLDGTFNILKQMNSERG